MRGCLSFALHNRQRRRSKGKKTWIKKRNHKMLLICTNVDWKKDSPSGTSGQRKKIEEETTFVIGVQPRDVMVQLMAHAPGSIQL